jgi:hypothetical protein
VFDDDSDSVSSSSSSKDAEMGDESAEGDGDESSEVEFDGALSDKEETTVLSRRSSKRIESTLSAPVQRLHPLHPLRKYDEFFEVRPEREKMSVKVRDLNPDGNAQHPPE